MHGYARAHYGRVCTSMRENRYVRICASLREYARVCEHAGIYDAGLPHPPSPPHPMVSPPPPLWGGACGRAFPRPPCGFVVVVGCTPGLVRSCACCRWYCSCVVLQTATRVDNRIIFDIMLNIIIVVVIFIISTIKEQLPPSPSPYNPHD